MIERVSCLFTAWIDDKLGELILSRFSRNEGTLVCVQKVVYSDTWYFSASTPCETRERVGPDAAPHDSPFRCNFGELRLPIVDCYSYGSDQTSLRVLVFDNPDFFCLLADSDRQFLLQIFAVALLHMVQEELSRFQYGFDVEILDKDLLFTLQYPYVEYYFTLIRSDFDRHLAQPRFVANIRSGLPTRRVRRCYEQLADLAERVQQRLEIENPTPEDL